MGSHRPGAQGYLKIGITSPSGRKYPQVHALVALAFLGAKPDGMQVNHRDGNTRNNQASNLEYVTQSGNQEHALAFALRSGMQGDAHPGAKLTDEQVRQIRRLLAAVRDSTEDLANTFGVSIGCIKDIRSGKTWRHVR
jgi:ribosomal protein S13